MGLATMLPLLKLVVTGYATLIAFVLLVLAPILLIARIPLRRFAAAVAEPAALGFATTSSEAALPLAMERMEAFGVPRWIVDVYKRQELPGRCAWSIPRQLAKMHKITE